jgi:hypothetical protein
MGGKGSLSIKPGRNEAKAVPAQDAMGADHQVCFSVPRRSTPEGFQIYLFPAHSVLSPS